MPVTADSGTIDADTGLLTADGLLSSVGQDAFGSGQTLGEVKAIIADDIARSDLGPQIVTALNAAVRRYQTERFFFNEGFLQFSTVEGQGFYDATTPVLLNGATQTAVTLGDIFMVDTAVVISGSTTYSLYPGSSARMDEADVIGSFSTPAWYAYFGRQVRLFPVPDGAYTVKLACHYKLPLPVNDLSANEWTNEASDLLLARAKWHLALHTIGDADLKARMELAIADALNMLAGRTNLMRGTGTVQGYNL